MGAETLIIGLAAGQHGVVTTAQLLGVGWSRDVIAARVRSGWLRRRHRGVYLVGPLETPHTQAMAAVLACGPRALVSHDPAAVLWELRDLREGPMHVIATGAHTRPRIVVHRASLHPSDITCRHGIPVTSAARTLLDLAATAPPKDVERAVNEAHVQRRITTHSLNEQFSRYPHHRGTAALMEAIRIAGEQVDMAWRNQRVVLEVDGYAFHSSRRSFELDRRRDQALAREGWRVIRVTWRQIQEEPEAIVATLATALAA